VLSLQTSDPKLSYSDNTIIDVAFQITSNHQINASLRAPSKWMTPDLVSSAKPKTQIAAFNNEIEQPESFLQVLNPFQATTNRRSQIENMRSVSISLSRLQ
jgi:hypothetical protein